MGAPIWGGDSLVCDMTADRFDLAVDTSYSASGGAGITADGARTGPTGDLNNSDFILAAPPPPPTVTDGAVRIDGTEAADAFLASHGNNGIRGLGGDETHPGRSRAPSRDGTRDRVDRSAWRATAIPDPGRVQQNGNVTF